MINIRDYPRFIAVLFLTASCSGSTELEVVATTSIQPEIRSTSSASDVPTEFSVLMTATKPIFPTDYPPDKQTQEIAATHTVEALMNATAAPTSVFETPAPCPTALPVEARATPGGTPMGDGFITNDVGRSGPSLMGLFSETSLAWIQHIGKETVIIYPGHLRDNPGSGALVIVRYGTSHDYPPGGELIESPAKTGKLEIIDAVGSRLVLRSDQGPLYYFDVEAMRFVGSVEAVVPTATRPATSPPSVPEWTRDDAPNDYSFVTTLQPFGEGLEYFIETNFDFDWFAFRNEEEATIQFSLSNLPDDYNLLVTRRCDFQTVGFSRQPGMADERVILDDAPPDVYFVLVYSGEGSADPDQPYILRGDFLDQ